MNHIPTKQNQEKYLKYLAAQRQLYDENKKWVSLILYLPIGFAFLGNIVFALVNWSTISPLVTWLTWIFNIVELFAILYLASNIRKSAAKIQELFDCEVLELSWNDALGPKPKPEVIYKAYDRFTNKHNQSEWEKLKNWYTHPELGELPLVQARIACQKENIWWDSEQRREYARGAIIATVLIFIVLITIGIIADWSLQQFLQGPIAISGTLLILGIKHGYRHIEAANRLDDLYNCVNELWEEASQQDVDDNKVTQKTRDLQTEIFHQRSDNPPVFSWFYNKIRKKYERISRESHT